MESIIGASVPIMFFAMIAAIVIVPRYFRSLERQKLAETMRAAIENGQQLPPEVVEALTSGTPARSAPKSDLRRGVVWLGVAVGLAIVGLVLGVAEPDATYPLLAISALPGFIGAAFLVLAWLNRKQA